MWTCDFMWSRGKTFFPVLCGLVCLLVAPTACAVDEEGCLFCHGLDLRSAAPQQDGRDLRVWEPPGGHHDALFCSDCHTDARRAPHAAAPGPAQCIGECHGQTAGAKEDHRRASYGGLIEPHRNLSSPGAPCRLCHRASDKAGTAEAILGRCAGCHAAARDSEIRGVHARISGPRGIGLCVGCHKAHQSGSGGAKTTCGAPGCHPVVTAGMMRLVGHKGGIAGGLASEAGLLIGIAALGWIVGRRLSPPGRNDGESG